MTDKSSESLKEVEQKNGRKLSWLLRLDVVALAGFLGLAGGMFYWGGQLSSRVEALEKLNSEGLPRSETNKRLRDIETGQATLAAQSANASTQRARIENKLDRLIEALSKAKGRDR